MNLEEQLNIELRGKILEYSLILEKKINDLVLLNLGFYDDEVKTKLFGNRGRISFQNKIDLLYDIEVLSKEENSEFELLMIIRNKFMHDIECDSFQTLLNQLDKGIVNRFKKFLEDDKHIINEDGKLIIDEKTCIAASYRLFNKNIQTIKSKIELNINVINKRYQLFQAQNKIIIYYIDAFYELQNKVSKAIENSESESSKVEALRMELDQILKETTNKLNNEAKTDIYEEYFNTDESVKAIFGLKGELQDWPKWEDYK